MVGTERLAVHLVSDQDFGGRVGGVDERQRSLEREVGGVDVLEHRVEDV